MNRGVDMPGGWNRYVGYLLGASLVVAPGMVGAGSLAAGEGEAPPSIQIERPDRYAPVVNRTGKEARQPVLKTRSVAVKSEPAPIEVSSPILESPPDQARTAAGIKTEAKAGPANGAEPAKTAEVAPEPVVSVAPVPEPAPPRILSREEVFQAKAADRAFYRLDDDARVLVLDMPNVEDQSRVFGRLVIFIERASAPRHRILSVPEVKKWRIANKETLATLTIGNNIRANDFALFFNTARFQNEPITEDEKWLLDRLLEFGVLREAASGLVSVEPEQIVISAPQVSTVDGCPACVITQSRRELILRHELAHARFVTDQVYRNYVWWFWHNVMTASQRSSVSKYLQALGYDLNAPDLLVNEMQAFLIHTPESEYFSSRAAGFTQSQFTGLHAAFREKYPSEAKPLRAPSGYRLQ